MRKLVRMLCRSSRKEKRLLYISYILNVFLISTIIMIVYALRSGIADLAESDAAQADMMASAMILVAVIIIIFFLWLIAMELKDLYDSRAQFNTNVKLMGLSNGKLTSLYLMEMLYMQPVSMVCGCVLGEIVYHFYAVEAGERMLWIQPGILIAAMALHLGMLLATVLLIGLRRGARSVVSELRGVRKRRKKKLPGVIVQAGIAVGVILAVYFSCKGFRALLDPTDALMGCQAMKLLYYVALIFAFDPVMLLAFRIAEWIGKITKAYHFRLALKLQESFWGRFKVMCFLFIFSGSLFCGLYSLYSSARLAGGSLAEKNIHYQSCTVYSEPSERGNEGTQNGTEYRTLKYQALYGEDSHFWVTGVDETYLNSCETLLAVTYPNDHETAQADRPWEVPDTYVKTAEPVDLAEDEKLAELLEDENFDGIILDDNDIFGFTENNKITLNFNGIDVTFTVYAGSLANDWGRSDAYVSRAYLEKQLGLEGYYNTVFYLEEPENADGEGASLTQTKEEICRESYTQAVKSTENIELVVWMILICSMMAVGTCLVMSCGDNRWMLACLQGMGTRREILTKIFLIQAVWNVLWVILPVVGMTNVLTRALGYLTLNPAYYSVSGFDVSPVRFALLFAAWFAVYAAIQLILIRRETKDGKCVEILRK